MALSKATGEARILNLRLRPYGILPHGRRLRFKILASPVAFDRGESKGDFRGDFKQDTEGDLMSSSGQVQVWFRLQLKFNSFELDSEKVGQIIFFLMSPEIVTIEA